MAYDRACYLVDYKNISTENRPFSRKIPIFSNFGPLRREQDINIFEQLFNIFKAYIKRQLLFALNGWQNKFLAPWEFYAP